MRFGAGRVLWDRVSRFGSGCVLRTGWGFRVYLPANMVRPYRAADIRWFAHLGSPTPAARAYETNNFAVHNFLVCVPAYSYRLGTDGGRPPWLPKEFQWLIFPASSST